MNQIEEKIKDLPSDLQQEVMDFIQFLLDKRIKKKGVKLRQNWAGSLREFRDKYTSLELQKKALEWRGE